MEPASTIIKRLGGEARASQITGTSAATPYKWQYPRSAKGTGGTIPLRHHRAILEYSKAHRLGITAEDLQPCERDQENVKPPRPRKYEGAEA